MLDATITPNPLSTDGWILVEPSVLGTIARFRQGRDDKPEAGGILLGFRRGPHLHIVEATVPTSRDRGWRTRFERSAEFHQHIALRRWQDTGGTMDYLGEWHTHPEANPAPSRLDLAAWQAIYAGRPNFPFVFVIAGSVDHCWLGAAQEPTLRQLTAGHDALRDVE